MMVFDIQSQTVQDDTDYDSNKTNNSRLIINFQSVMSVSENQLRKWPYISFVSLKSKAIIIIIDSASSLFFIFFFFFISSPAFFFFFFRRVKWCKKFNSVDQRKRVCHLREKGCFFLLSLSPTKNKKLCLSAKSLGSLFPHLKKSQQLS